MILSKGFFFAGLALSAALHLSLAGWQSPPEAPQLSGGEIAGEVTLGNSFADLAAGVISPVAGEADRAEPVPVQEKAPLAEAMTAPSPAPHVEKSVAASAIAVSVQVRLEPVVPEVSEVAQAISHEIAALSPTEAAPQIQKPTPSTARPMMRPERNERPAPARQSPAPKRGTAAVTAVAGQAEGQAKATNRESSQAKKTIAEQLGGKALKRYQANVLRKIDRAPKRGAGAKGSAVIGLGIGQDGRVMVLKVVKTSGNPQIDQIALQQVRRAAPFAPPPHGGTVKFTLRVKAQG
ncbi:MAG: TonB family protein [Mangrovicoccus sp.]